MQYQYNFKNADIICYMLKLLVCLQQGNVNKSKIKIFEKMSYDNIKSHKKTGL